jgi:IclR family transcriptional regulator, acetate operon repressor
MRDADRKSRGRTSGSHPSKAKGQQTTRVPEHVKTAARTLDFFEVFANARGPLSLTDLAQRIGSPVSSCHALVRTLQARGYAYVLDERKRVYPTKRLAALAQAIARHDPVLERLSPILARLAKATGETVLLGKRQSDWITYLDVIEGVQTIRYAAKPGDTKPLHSSAIGKAMLSLLDDEHLERLLKKLKLPRITDRTITDPVRLRADLVRGRARGYYTTHGENVPDVMGISIARRIGEEPYGIAVAGPMARLDARLETYVAALLEAGKALEHVDIELRGAA